MTVDEMRKLRKGDRVSYRLSPTLRDRRKSIRGTVVEALPNCVRVRWDDGGELSYLSFSYFGLKWADIEGMARRLKRVKR